MARVGAQMGSERCWAT